MQWHWNMTITREQSRATEAKLLPEAPCLMAVVVVTMMALVPPSIFGCGWLGSRFCARRLTKPASLRLPGKGGIFNKRSESELFTTFRCRQAQDAFCRPGLRNGSSGTATGSYEPAGGENPGGQSWGHLSSKWTMSMAALTGRQWESDIIAHPQAKSNRDDAAGVGDT